jgi:hypothetical protein
MGYWPQNVGCGIGNDGRCVSGWPIFRLSNTILGCFTCYEGLFRQIPDSSLLYASNSQSVMPGCIHPRSIQGRDRSDHYASKSCIHARKEGLLTSEVICNNAPIRTVPEFCRFHKIKKDEIHLCRLVFYWSPSFKILSIRGDNHHEDPIILLTLTSQ